MNLRALPGTDHPISSTSAPLPALAHAAEQRLWRSGYLALRNVSCRACDGVVSLHGCLPSYYLKQVAQELASGVEGARLVINRIEVLAPAGRQRQGPETLAGQLV
jgi:osmotically-inducible protein OsmY